jgi:hypothetical protein
VSAGIGGALVAIIGLVVLLMMQESEPKVTKVQVGKRAKQPEKPVAPVKEIKKDTSKDDNVAVRPEAPQPKPPAKDADQQESKPKEEDSDKQDVRKAKREALLAELGRKEEEDLAAIDAKLAQYRREKERYEDDVDNVKRHPRYGDVFDREVRNRYNDLLATHNRLQRKLQNLSDVIETKRWEREQERRKILRDYPEPDDPTFEEYKGELLTSEEIRTKKAKKEQNQRGSRIGPR